MKFLPATAVMATAVLLGACSTELEGFGTKQSAVESNRVLAAPTGSVESSPMSSPAAAAATTTLAPPPKAYGAAAVTAGAAVTPTATASNVPLTPPAVNAGGVAYAAANDVQEQLSGAWTFGWDEGRRSCPLTLSTARGASGLSAQADISCPSEIFMTKGWETLGPDLVLQNHVGKVTVRLQPDGPNRYLGTIADSGQPVTLTR